MFNLKLSCSNRFIFANSLNDHKTSVSESLTFLRNERCFKSDRKQANKIFISNTSVSFNTMKRVLHFYVLYDEAIKIPLNSACGTRAKYIEFYPGLPDFNCATLTVAAAQIPIEVQSG